MEYINGNIVSLLRCTIWETGVDLKNPCHICKKKSININFIPEAYKTIRCSIEKVHSLIKDN